jgi:hypothetical protein
LSLIGDPLLVPFFPTISLSVSVSMRGSGLIDRVFYLYKYLHTGAGL